MVQEIFARSKNSPEMARRRLHVQIFQRFFGPLPLVTFGVHFCSLVDLLLHLQTRFLEASPYLKKNTRPTGSWVQVDCHGCRCFYMNSLKTAQVVVSCYADGKNMPTRPAIDEEGSVSDRLRKPFVAKPGSGFCGLRIV